MFALLIFTLVALTAPSTSPATTQALTLPQLGNELKQLSRQIQEQQAKASDARSTCLSRLRATDNYQKLQADLDAKDRALNDARKHGTSSEKLAASSAFTIAKARLQKLQDDALASDPDISAAMKALSQSRRAWQIADARYRDAERAEAIRAIEKAKAKKVEQGMTIDEVMRLWGDPAEKTESDNGVTVCKWYEYVELTIKPRPEDYEFVHVSPLDLPSPRQMELPPKRRVLTRSLLVVFSNGKAAQVRDTSYALPDD